MKNKLTLLLCSLAMLARAGTISSYPAGSAVSDTDLYITDQYAGGVPSTYKETALQLHLYMVGPGDVDIESGKTATFSNTLTFAGTDSSTLNIGSGGTLGSAAFTATSAYDAAGAAATAQSTAEAASIPSTYLSTDGTFAADSDTKVPSQKATVTYVGSAITTFSTGQMDFVTGNLTSTGSEADGIDINMTVADGMQAGTIYSDSGTSDSVFAGMDWSADAYYISDANYTGNRGGNSQPNGTLFAVTTSGGSYTANNMMDDGSGDSYFAGTINLPGGGSIQGDVLCGEYGPVFDLDNLIVYGSDGETPAAYWNGTPGSFQTQYNTLDDGAGNAAFFTLTSDGGQVDTDGVGDVNAQAFNAQSEFLMQDTPVMTNDGVSGGPAIIDNSGNVILDLTAQQPAIDDPADDTDDNNAAIISVLQTMRTYGLIAPE